MERINPPEVYQKDFPEIWEAYLEMNQRCHKKGPLNEKICQLIIVAVAATAKSEGGVKAHTRMALEAGAKPEEVRQAILLTLGPAGFSTASSAMMWANEVLGAK